MHAKYLRGVLISSVRGVGTTWMSELKIELTYPGAPSDAKKSGETSILVISKTIHSHSVVLGLEGGI